MLPNDAYQILSAIIDTDFNISFINKIEILGHHSAGEAWQNFINQAVVFEINEEIIDQTIYIRKNHKIKLPDAIVAATAIVNDLTLVTRNISDFKNLSGIVIENPWDWKPMEQ